MEFGAKTAFAAFYAVFWAALLVPMGKFSPFGIDGFRKGTEARLKNLARFAAGIMILNVFPAIWFAFLFKCDSVVPKTDSASAFIAAAITAISVFSFVNLGYAVFGAKPCVNYLHTKDELKEPKLKNALEKVHSGWFVLLALLYFVTFPSISYFIHAYHFN